MKSILSLTLLFILISYYSACTKNEVVSDPILPGDPFEVQAWDYSTSHYFVDTMYSHFYEPFYMNEPPIITAEMQQDQLIEVEVWVEYIGTDPIQIANAIQGISYISIPPRGNGYNSSMRRVSEMPGVVELGRFIRLNPWEYTLTGDGYLGILSLDDSVKDRQIVAIGYRCANGEQFGEFLRNVPAESLATGMPIILKMVKPKNLMSYGPLYQPAWHQLVKSIYSLHIYDVDKRDFTLNIFTRLPDGRLFPMIVNAPSLRVLSLDRFTPEELPAPEGDGLFDFRPGRTIDPNRGEIIFPQLRPFDRGIQYYFRSKGISIEDTSSYLFSEIYDTTKTVAQASPRNKYVIKGRAFHD